MWLFILRFYQSLLEMVRRIWDTECNNLRGQNRFSKLLLPDIPSILGTRKTVDSGFFHFFAVSLLTFLWSIYGPGFFFSSRNNRLGFFLPDTRI
jgi:hypothetical protein